MTAEVRAGAASVLVEVLAGGRSLTRALEDAEPTLADRRDRGLLKLLCYTTLRHYHWLDAVLGGLLNRPMKPADEDIRLLLLSGLGQLQVLEMPAHAVVSTSCDASVALGKPWARGLVNAVLRNFLRGREACVQRANAHAVARYSHPQWLIDRLRADWPEDFESILEAGNRPPPLWLRINLGRSDADSCVERLRSQGLDVRRLDGLPTGLRVEPAIDVHDIPGFAEGLMSVQDGAAQLVPALLDLAPGQRVLDACAAPGGKTVAMLEACPELAEVLALDVDPARLQSVNRALSRGGHQAKLIAADARDTAQWWDGQPFQRILLDAPCSATGVIRRHPDIKLLRRPTDIAASVALQSALLDALWPLLEPGGRLLYATCSVLKDENARQVQAFLSRHADARALPLLDLPAGRPSGPGWQILSGEGGLDGFFYSALVKA